MGATPDDETIASESEVDVSARTSLAGGPSALPDLAEGAAVGHFRVEGKLGEGGMGVVYRATDERLCRAVALKVLPPDFAADAGRRQRFLREARSAAALVHPNIATVFEVGEADERVFLAMELVEGQTLRRLIEGRRPSIDEALRIAREIARGLAKAHKAGIVHRDLKHDNVMITPDGDVKILDFGLAKRLDAPSAPDPASALTGAGVVMGTPGFMSPEQMRGHPVDARTDVFAFGVMLYDLLAGARPFTGSTAADLLVAVLTKEPPPLAQKNPAVDPELARFVARCLAKDAAERPADGQALLAWLSGGGPASADTAWTPSAGLPGAADRDRKVERGAEPTIVPTLPAATAPAPPRSRARTLLFVALSGAAAFATTWILRGAAERSPAPSPSPSAPAAIVTPLRDSKAIVACPLLDARGPAPAGWLGAAAASFACGRVTTMLGEDAARTLVPAELLDLPRGPTASAPPDPYCEPGARERSLAAAKARAQAYLDGAIELAKDRFTVTFELRTAEGALVDRAAATDAHFIGAVATAIDALAERGAIPIAAEPIADVAAWSPRLGVRDRLAAADALARVASFTEPERGCAWFEENGARIGPVVLANGRAWCRGFVKTPPGPAVAIDHASGRAIVATLTAEASVGHEAELAREVRAAFDKELSAFGRATLATVEAALHFGIGDAAHARERAVVALGLRVRNDEAWSTAVAATEGPDARATAIGAAHWRPWLSDTWNVLSRANVTGAVDERLPPAQRAYLLAPGSDTTAIGYAEVLLHAGRVDDARAVGAKLAADPRTEASGRALLIRSRASEGRFSEALAAYQKLLVEVDPLSAAAAWYRSIAQARELATILGRGEAFGQWFSETFIEPERPKIQGTDQYGVLVAAPTCLLASRPVAKRCLARLRALLAAHYFVAGFAPASLTFFEGAEAFVAGDVKRALAAWRPLAKRPSLQAQRFSVVLAQPFDDAGEPDVAERIDAYDLAHAGEHNGASLAMLRAARRAAKAGDDARALDLARRVMTAWSAADEAVPAVDEMRKLVRALEQKGAKGR